ncbi:MAG TPA: hypothetical protein VF815_04095 [Myxococcaceae bacterium]
MDAWASWGRADHDGEDDAALQVTASHAQRLPRLSQHTQAWTSARPESTLAGLVHER